MFWHTQGSGKTFSMLFFSQKVLRKIPGNWSFVIVTDRDDLDDQAYKEFACAGVVDREAHAGDRSAKHLRQLLAEDHRYVFTLIQNSAPSRARRIRCSPSETTSSSSPTRPTAPSTTRSRSTCATRCRTPASSASPGRR